MTILLDNPAAPSASKQLRNASHDVRPRLAPRHAGILCLDDFETAAQRHLPRPVYQEVSRNMALLGVTSLDQLEPGHLVRALPD